MRNVRGLRRAAADLRWTAAGIALLASACGGGGGGGVTSTPAPAPAPTPSAAPAPSPAPTPSPTPAAVFETSEYRGSGGPAFHSAVTAWQQGATGQGVTLAIVDTGIDTGNPEFAGRISSASADVAGSRGIQSEDFHGPMVALVAAAARNDTGVMGIAWQSTILALRADRPGSCSTDCTFSSTAVAAGIDRAVANGAKVINLSLGGGDPGAQVHAAVARAASAGVVVVVGAGNKPQSQAAAAPDPDEFAMALRRAGNGNVIIAGSVNGSGVISSFSNRAGVEAGSYLSALGEGVCCVYDNGVINTSIRASGTSFSAPQISGAVALLRQAFPNLSATQVVDLLLRTARDAGATGTDAIYGRGILDIANAFAPQGQITAAGTTTAVALGAAAVTSPAMGDAVQGAAIGTVVLDSYQRAYAANLAVGLRPAPLASRLAPALGARSFAVGAGPVSMSYSLDARAHPGSLWSGQLRLGPEDTQRARVLAARVAAKIAPDTQLAFAFAQGADGLAAQVRGAHGPAFFIAGSPFDDTGFARDDQLSVALRRQFGPWGLTLGAETAKAVDNAIDRTVKAAVGGDRDDAVTRIGISVDRDWGPIAVALGASWLAEDRTVLGARFQDALGGGGADSLFLDGEISLYPREDWRIGAAWRQGYTHARPLGLIATGSHFSSDSWSIDVAHAGMFQSQDEIALRVSQPLRVRSGGLRLTLPVSWDYDTLVADYASHRVSVAPKGREIDTELTWTGELGTGRASASLFYRKDPGHFAGISDDKGAAFSWSTVF